IYPDGFSIMEGPREMRNLRLLSKTTVCILFIMIAVFFFTPFSVSADQDDSLQSLIDDTPAIGELKLEGKVYKGNIYITKPITIIGQEGTEFHVESNNNVITLQASDTTINSVAIKYC